MPQRIENLLAAGVSAHRKPPNIRGRETVMTMGEAAGIAAAMAANQSIFPREINVRSLQRKLVDSGVYLGDQSRVASLFGSPASD